MITARLFSAASRPLARTYCPPWSSSIISQQFSVLNRPPPSYPGHVPLTGLEKAALGLGAAVGAFWNPRRADLVAAVGEVTGGPFLERLRDTMLASETGRRILHDRPRITSQTIPTETLRSCPENSLGRVYADFRDRYRLSPDERDQVKYIDNEECAFVMQRYRECHDIYHAIFRLPPSFIEGEIALKAFEFGNTGLPMTALSLFAVTRLKPKERDRVLRIYLPWALRSARCSQPLINVYWEEEVDTDVDVLLGRLGLERPPDMHDLRRRARKPE